MITENIERSISEPPGSVLTSAELQRYARRVGTLGVVDDDVVEVSNLQRQVSHGQSTLQMAKVDSARQRMADLNPYHQVVDGSDSFTTRYLVNDACFLLHRPYVWGSVFQFHGQASVFCTPAGPCYRRLYPEPPPPRFAPSCEGGGVFGAVCATVASVVHDVVEVRSTRSVPADSHSPVRTISATELAGRLARRRAGEDDAPGKSPPPIHRDGDRRLLQGRHPVRGCGPGSFAGQLRGQPPQGRRARLGERRRTPAPWLLRRRPSAGSRIKPEIEEGVA